MVPDPNAELSWYSAEDLERFLDTLVQDAIRASDLLLDAEDTNEDQPGLHWTRRLLISQAFRNL